MRENTISAFLDSLADRTPAPGGGASAALHLGQAAALVSMVARYSTGPRYAEHAAAVERICSSADAIRKRALGLAEADMAAFTSVVDAYRLPKSPQDAAAARKAAITAALTDAARVPADVLIAVREVVELADELLSVANPSVISDVAAAAEAARAAATTARVNVEVNLPRIPQGLRRIELLDALSTVDDAIAHCDHITSQVRKQLNP